MARAIELLEHVVKTEVRMYNEGDPRLLPSQEALEDAYAALNEGQDTEGWPDTAVFGDSDVSEAGYGPGESDKGSGQ